MVKSLSEHARSCSDVPFTNCVVIGQRDKAKLSFIDVLDSASSSGVGVTLTRNQIEALAGMLNAYLDSGDPEAVGMF